jgi:hypothetical protein
MNELIQSLGDKAENHSIGELEYPSDTEDEDYEDMDWDYDIPRDDGDRVYMKSDDCICYLNKNKYPSIKLKCCGKVMHLVCMLTYYYSDCPTKYLCPFCRNDWSNSTYNGEFVIVQLDNEGNLIYPANPPGNSWGDIPDEEWVVGGTL